MPNPPFYGRNYGLLFLRSFHYQHNKKNTAVSEKTGLKSSLDLTKTLVFIGIGTDQPEPPGHN